MARQPRSRIQREFSRWLAVNASRFQVPLHSRRRTDRSWEFRFAGLVDVLRIHLVRHEIAVAVVRQGECIDLLTCFEAAPKRSRGGVGCQFCTDSDAWYPSLAALWIDHLFEPLLDWVNGQLAVADSLELSFGGGWSAARLIGLPWQIAHRESGSGVRVEILPLRQTPYSGVAK